MMTHEQRLMKEAIATVKKRWGMGFDQLGPELQQALVRAQVLSTIGQIASVEDSGAGKLATLALRWSPEDEGS